MSGIHHHHTHVNILIKSAQNEENRFNNITCKLQVKFRECYEDVQVRLCLLN